MNGFKILIFPQKEEQNSAPEEISDGREGFGHLAEKVFLFLFVLVFFVPLRQG